MLIDSHSHLNLTEHFDDLQNTHSAMVEAGVEAAIVVGIDLETSQKALELASSWIFPTVGIHPQTDNFDDEDPEQWQALENLLSHPACVAVGETGMDFYHDRVPEGVQKKRFIRHLELAKRLNLPAVVHCRDADEAVEQVLEEYGQGTRGVLHCWAGGISLALKAISMNWCVSLAGNITFKNAGSLREAAASIPSAHFLVETDCPFLAPHPHRGQANHPALLVHTARQLAQTCQMSEEDIARLTRKNTIDLFRLPLKKEIVS